ncbi:unnamed protein product [Lupinus luteus]|uniref:Uncharacterized protein n=1 Tax=Lupinus luteus TaxID=3873 RepID=A0AAV1XH28_LUPLU
MDHATLNVEELMKHQKYHATFCVYRVPKSFSSTKPEAFIPQFVGLGPYHHCIPQICFDYLKISAVTTVLNHTNVLNKVVQQLTNSNLASLIRDCYDTTIVFKDYTLLYLMTVDSLFLYDLLSNSVIVTEDEESVDTVTKVDLKSSIFAAKHRMPLVNYGGVELTKDAIIRDIFMLENQIPIHIVEEIMKVIIINMESDEPHPQYEDMGSKMLQFCKALCPFIYPDQQLPIQSEEAMKHVHLLDLMYHSMLRNPNPAPDEHDPNFNPDEHVPNFNPDKNAEQSDSTLTRLKKMYLPMYNLIVLGTMPDGEPIIGGGEGCIYHGIVKSIHGSFSQKSTNLDKGVVIIPSVTELHKAGIHFNPAYGIISFSENRVRLEEFIFYLPKIRLDQNSEVIMRNLVAYESLTQSNCLYLTKYVELMRSLIKSAKDVKVLVDEKIIQTKLSGAQVMQIFNEINKSIRPTNTADLDQMIIRVNYVFHSLKFEKLRKFLVKFVLPIWVVLVLAAIIGCSILLVDLIIVTLEDNMQDIIKCINSVIKVFHWF